MNAPADLSGVKQTPFSHEAEQSVIGGLLLDQNAWDDVSAIISPEDFHSKIHRTIFDAVKSIIQSGKTLDLIVLQETLEETGKLEIVGGFAYLVEIVRVVPSAANITAYAKLVKERSLTRSMIAIGNEMVEAGYNTQGKPVSEIVDSYQTKLDALIESGSSDEKPATMTDTLNYTLDKLEEIQRKGGSITGLSSGYPDLDKLTSGFQPADMIVIAGRPSMGKTTIAMNIADHVAQTSGKHVLVFSLEMPKDQLMRRLLASNGLVSMNHLNNADLSDEDWGRLSMATGKLLESKMLIDDAGGLTPAEMRSRAKKANKENELGLIVIDYMGKLRVPNLANNRNLEISEISQSVKELAKELNIPIIVLSQLNRGLEQRSDKRPVNSDLRDSGSIEQDADVIMFVYRDEVYHDDSPDKGTAEIIIGKQRNGPLGKVRLTFQGEYSRFCSFAGPSFREDY